MVPQQLILFLGVVASFPYSTPRLDAQAPNGQALYGNISIPSMDQQVAMMEAQLPPGFRFNMSALSPSHRSSNVYLPALSTDVSTRMTCLNSLLLPPSLDDCNTLLYRISKLGFETSFAPLAGRCMYLDHRSCLAFNCAGLCQTRGYNMAEWYAMLTPIMDACVIGRGMGGASLAKRMDGNDWGKMVGMDHSNAIKSNRFPPMDPC